MLRPLNRNSIKNLLSDKEFSNMCWLFFGALISADTLMCAEDCQVSLNVLKTIEDILDKKEVPDMSAEMEAKIRKFLQDGVKIVNQDLEYFKEQSKNNNTENEGRNETVINTEV